jgi:hypothetical protein
MAQPSDFWNQQVGEQAVRDAFYLPSIDQSTTEVVTDSPEISKGSAWPVLLILLALFG